MFNRAIIQQVSKYFVVAAIGLAADYAVLIFLKEIVGLHYLVAVAGGFMVGLIINYILSNRYVFGAPKGSHRVIFILFGLVGIGGLVILDVLVWLFTGVFGLNYIASKTVATIFVFAWNFLVRRLLFYDEVGAKTP